jgi:hypothetical protein
VTKIQRGESFVKNLTIEELRKPDPEPEFLGMRDAIPIPEESVE